MSTPLVSVCIPTFNRADFLSDAIDSILAQTFRDFELVVSDNASTDETPEVLGRYRDPRLRLHRNDSNLGLVGNFNRCLQLARAPYLVLCCADDYWAPRLLEQEVLLFEQHSDLSYLHVGSLVVDANKSPIGPNVLDLRPVTPGREYFRRFLLEDLNGTNFSSVLYRRDRLLEIGGFDARLPHTQDLAVWARLALRGDVGYVAQPLVFFRKHRENYHVRWNWEAYFRERFVLIEMMFTEWPETRSEEFTGLREQVRRAMAQRVARSLAGQRLEGASRFSVLALALHGVRRSPGILLDPGLLKLLAPILLSPEQLSAAISRFGTTSRTRPILQK
jgi:glycosyltransferase involved in cell wall biosynthesis